MIAAVNAMSLIFFMSPQTNEFPLTFTFALRCVKRQKPPADQAGLGSRGRDSHWAVIDATSQPGISPGSSSPELFRRIIDGIPAGFHEIPAQQVKVVIDFVILPPTPAN